MSNVSAVNAVIVEVLLDKIKIATGIITQLQVNKVNVNEARTGQECGIRYEGKAVINEGDILAAYLEEIKDKKIE